MKTYYKYNKYKLLYFKSFYHLVIFILILIVTLWCQQSIWLLNHPPFPWLKSIWSINQTCPSFRVKINQQAVYSPFKIWRHTLQMTSYRPIQRLNYQWQAGIHFKWPMISQYEVIFSTSKSFINQFLKLTKISSSSLIFFKKWIDIFVIYTE